MPGIIKENPLSKHEPLFQNWGKLDGIDNWPQHWILAKHTAFFRHFFEKCVHRHRICVCVAGRGWWWWSVPYCRGKLANSSVPRIFLSALKADIPSLSFFFPQADNTLGQNVKSEKKLTKGRLLKSLTFKPSTTRNWAHKIWCIHIKSQFYHRQVYSVDQGSISLDCLLPSDFFFTLEWQPTPPLPDFLFGFVNINTLTLIIKFCRLGSFSISLRWFCASSLWAVALLLLFFLFFCMPHDMSDLSSLARDWTCAPSVGVWCLNHWTAREVPDTLLLVFNFLRATLFPSVLDTKVKSHFFPLRIENRQVLLLFSC